VATLALVGCGSGSTVHFTGTAHPPVATAEQVETFGRDTPSGYAVIGVVTAQCGTLNEASGLLSDPCSEEDMLRLAKSKAAASGGSALVDAVCRNNETQRLVERRDGGGIQTTVRATLTCRATVVRLSGAAALQPPTASRAHKPPTRRVDVSGIAVEVSFIPARGRKRRPSRAETDVGELERLPGGYELLGQLKSECVFACSRWTAKRGLRAQAARVGATAFAAPVCELLGDRWRCEATAIGDARVEATDAGVIASHRSDATATDEGPTDAGMPPVADDAGARAAEPNDGG